MVFYSKTYTKHHLRQYFLNAQVNHDPLAKVNDCHNTKSKATNNNTTKDDWNNFSLYCFLLTNNSKNVTCSTKVASTEILYSQSLPCLWNNKGIPSLAKN
jgi:hypothetical protein